MPSVAPKRTLFTVDPGQLCLLRLAWVWDDGSLKLNHGLAWVRHDGPLKLNQGHQLNHGYHLNPGYQNAVSSMS